MGGPSAGNVFKGGTRQMDKLFARLCEKNSAASKGAS
jgi:hypothetical protein